MLRPPLATAEQLKSFHADDYVNFLRCVNPGNQSELLQGEASSLKVEYAARVLYRAEVPVCRASGRHAGMRKFNVGEDCPAFDGLFDFCRRYTGGSLAGVHRLLVAFVRSMLLKDGICFRRYEA